MNRYFGVPSFLKFIFLSAFAISFASFPSSCVKSEVAHYFIGEKSVGRMYVRSIFSTFLLACSDLMTS